MSRQSVSAARSSRSALILACLGYAGAAAAQDPAPTGDTPPPVASEPATVEGARSFTPVDFARFAPRSALDMLNQVPGFSINAGDTERRGLGEATANVVINGERISGKNTDVFVELQRISATNVARIDIVDGATLNVPGLTGQVANIITLTRGLSGNFAWRPQIRARRTEARLFNGEVSINGSLNPSTTFTLSLANDAFRNGNAGLEEVFTPDGAITDLRDEELYVYGDQPRLSGSLRRNFADGSVLNANGAFQLYIFDLAEFSTRSGPGQPDRQRDLTETEREYNYELGGDYEFALGGGRLKLIGLRRFEHSPYTQTVFQSFADNRPTEGDRFRQVGDETETIARAEYRWRGGGADWQVSLEGALNLLDVESEFFRFTGGDFVPVAGSANASQVEEKRAEATLSYGRPLSTTLSMQATVGAEYSQLSQTGANGLTRTFYRPKGSLALAWRPEPGLDISARIERVVGQLNFFDFVASGNLSAGTANAGNANLVPPQSWDAQIQATRSLGAWGTATARLYGRWITDIVDIIPIDATSQSPGNLDGTARVYGLQWTSTFNFDPLGWQGAKLDASMQFQRTSLVDPLTRERRPFNATLVRRLDFTLRHDVPGSDWAYGAGFNQYRQSALFRLDQRWQDLATPGNLGVFVEHKDVIGLTVRASVDNLLGNNESFTRDFYNGRRPSQIILTESRNRYFGPIFTLSISGTI